VDSRHLHRRRVTKRLSQIALDGVLRREVDLLEELGGDADAAGGADAAQGLAVIHVWVVEVAAVVGAVVEVLLQGAVVEGAVGLGACDGMGGHDVFTALSGFDYL
jgi:hypothetical protein